MAGRRHRSCCRIGGNPTQTDSSYTVWRVRCKFSTNIDGSWEHRLLLRLFPFYAIILVFSTSFWLSNTLFAHSLKTSGGRQIPMNCFFFLFPPVAWVSGQIKCKDTRFACRRFGYDRSCCRSLAFIPFYVHINGECVTGDDDWVQQLWRGLQYRHVCTSVRPNSGKAAKEQSDNIHLFR